MVIQNECYRVVTIAYLKSIIKDGSTYLIQNSSGGGVDVDLTVLSSEKRRDDYCPTFKELTKGDLIPNWKAGTTPNGDTDGISITIPPILGGTKYADDQLVDQNDLLVKYTRFSGLTISASKTSMSECGDNATISFEHKYIRRTKAMDGCPTDRPITYKTTSAATSDTVCSELTWHTDYGSVTDCTTYTIGKNGSVSANSRTDNVYATVDFRGEQRSNTLKMNQAALTGSYNRNYPVSGTYRKVEVKIKDGTCKGVPDSLTVYGTNSNQTCTVNATVSLEAIGVYNEYQSFYWVDSCGEVYTTKTQEQTITSGGEESITPPSYTFNYTTGCCDARDVKTHLLSITYGSSTCSKTFSAVCEACTCCSCTVMVLDPVSPSAHGSSKKQTVATYSSDGCGNDWRIQFVSGDDSIFSNFEFRSDGYLYAENSANPGTTTRSATYDVTVGTCTKRITLYQEGYDIPPSCSEVVLDGMRLHADSSGRSEYDSSRILSDEQAVAEGGIGGGRFGVYIFYDDIAGDAGERVINSKTQLNNYISGHAYTLMDHPERMFHSSSREGTAGPVKTDFHAQWSGQTLVNRCVTATLQYKAALARGEVTKADVPGCNLANCGYSDYSSGCLCPNGCREGCCEFGKAGIYKPTDDAIRYVLYTLAANDSNKRRLVFVYWYPDGGQGDLPEYDWFKLCESSRVAFLQEP